jgi:hypothetical protein
LTPTAFVALLHVPSAAVTVIVAEPDAAPVGIATGPVQVLPPVFVRLAVTAPVRFTTAVTLDTGSVPGVTSTVTVVDIPALKATGLADGVPTVAGLLMVRVTPFESFDSQAVDTFT